MTEPLPLVHVFWSLAYASVRLGLEAFIFSHSVRFSAGEYYVRSYVLFHLMSTPNDECVK